MVSEKHNFNINTEQLNIEHLRTTCLFREVVISLLGKCKYWRTAPRSNKGSLLGRNPIQCRRKIDMLTHAQVVRWQNRIVSAECLGSLCCTECNYLHLLLVPSPAPDTGHWSHWPLQSRTTGLRNSPHTATTVPPPVMCSV